MSQVLIVDDEPSICWTIREALTDDGHHVLIAGSAEEAFRLLDEGATPDVVLLDIRLPGMDGLTALSRLRPQLEGTPVVVMTAFGNLETAVRAVELGAFDYLFKPFDLDQAMKVIDRARALGNASPAPVPAATAGDTSQLAGSSPALQQVFKKIAQVAGADTSVLITGESGTGKELVAQAIHRYSPRREALFLPVCIPALNPGLIESELFGHTRGAFTGAAENRQGLLELAQGGTVLLDEIGDIPPGLQVKLLRALEQREVTAVGDVRPRPLNVRILAATNQDLPTLIASGQFREDLYYRLGAFHIHLPPLRERREDIPVLAEYFLQQSRQQLNEPSLSFATDALDELLARDWRGNVRELRNAVDHAALVARSRAIGREHLPPVPMVEISQPLPRQIQSQLADWALATVRSDGKITDLYEQFLNLAEPAVLKALLQYTGDNRAAAASILGLHRATLRQKLKRHRLGTSLEATDE